jgi:hypothetical protein
MTNKLDDLAAIWRTHQTHATNVLSPDVVQERLSRLSVRRKFAEKRALAAAALSLWIVQSPSIASLALGDGEVTVAVKIALVLTHLSTDTMLIIYLIRRFQASHRSRLNASAALRENLRAALAANDEEKREVRLLIGLGAGIQLVFLSLLRKVCGGWIAFFLAGWSSVATFAVLVISLVWYSSYVLRHRERRIAECLGEFPEN